MLQKQTYFLILLLLTSCGLFLAETERFSKNLAEEPQIIPDTEKVIVDLVEAL